MVETGPHRRIAFVRTDLDVLKAVKNEHGGTVNDVVLSVVTGAIGNYLRARGHDTEGLEMRAMVPVSVRAEEEHGALGNRISAMMAPLPVWCEAPVQRLHLITETMGDLKGSGQAVGAEILTRIVDFAPTTIASQAARLQPAQRFFNLVVTNVPGPQFPLYVLGRRMESIFPLVPLMLIWPVIFAGGSALPFAPPDANAIRKYSPGAIVPPRGCLPKSQPFPVADAYCSDHPVRSAGAAPRLYSST